VVQKIGGVLEVSLVGGGVRKKPGWRQKSGRSGVGRGEEKGCGFNCPCLFLGGDLDFEIC
jgi:hypothetical protein